MIWNCILVSAYKKEIEKRVEFRGFYRSSLYGCLQKEKTIYNKNYQDRVSVFFVRNE